MDSKLSSSNMKEIRRTLTCAYITYLDKIKNQKFSVGDILIRNTYEADFELKDEIFSKPHVEMYVNSVLPMRFLVVHVDDKTNAAFCKSIKENGKLDNDVIHCTVDFVNDVGWKSFSIFEVDPDFVDAMILGEDFNIGALLEEEKQRKSSLVKMNRISAVSFDDLKRVNAFIKSLKPGETFYCHDNNTQTFNSNDFSSICVGKPRRVAFKDYAKTERYRVKDKYFKEWQLNDKHVFYIRCAQKTSLLITTIDLIGKALYKSKPIVLKENL